jgi:hypothetical protein
MVHGFRVWKTDEELALERKRQQRASLGASLSLIGCAVLVLIGVALLAMAVGGGFALGERWLGQ